MQPKDFRPSGQVLQRKGPQVMLEALMAREGVGTTATVHTHGATQHGSDVNVKLELENL